MSSGAELRKEQTEKLFDLLKIKKLNKDIIVQGLDESIARTKSSMPIEEISHVEKMINELYK